MTKYEVIQAAEINGKQRFIGEILKESDFSKQDAGRVFEAKERPKDMSPERYKELVTNESEEIGKWVAAPTELHSLLRSGHVRVIN